MPITALSPKDPLSLRSLVSGRRGHERRDLENRGTYGYRDFPEAHLEHPLAESRY
jgi:hypothetical protein